MYRCLFVFDVAKMADRKVTETFISPYETDDSQLGEDSVEAKYQEGEDEIRGELVRSPAQMLCKCCVADTTGADAETFEKKGRTT